MSQHTIPSTSTRSVAPMLDIAIVGGGLSGLLLAHEIHTKTPTKTWTLLEARPTLGGRLKNDTSNRGIDMGGAWIWPRNQPRILNLVHALGISTFPQPDDLTSTRIVGGAVEIPRTIAGVLPEDRLRISSPVVACRLVVPGESSGVETSCDSTTSGGENAPHVALELLSGETVRAKRVVLTSPPKLTSLRISFTPSLPASKMRAMSSSQTWMAGVTKVSLVYQSPRFWSLDESNRGFRPGTNRPAFQVYDASPSPESGGEESSISALTFFTLASFVSSEHISGADDDDDDRALADACAEQISNAVSLASVGRGLKLFDEYHIQRWPTEHYISEDDNPNTISPHPVPVSELSKTEWDGMLLFSGTETDEESPGVMDGAVGSALQAMGELRTLWGDD